MNGHGNVVAIGIGAIAYVCIRSHCQFPVDRCVLVDRKRHLFALIFALIRVLTLHGGFTTARRIGWDGLERE